MGVYQGLVKPAEQGQPGKLGLPQGPSHSGQPKLVVLGLVSESTKIDSKEAHTLPPDVSCTHHRQT